MDGVSALGRFYTTTFTFIVHSSELESGITHSRLRAFAFDLLKIYLHRSRRAHESLRWAQVDIGGVFWGLAGMVFGGEHPKCRF